MNMINVRDNWLETGDDAAHHAAQTSGGDERNKGHRAGLQI